MNLWSQDTSILTRNFNPSKCLVVQCTRLFVWMYNCNPCKAELCQRKMYQGRVYLLKVHVYIKLLPQLYTLNNTCFLFFYNRNNCWVLEHTTSLTLLITCPESLAANEECVKQEKQDLIPQNWLVSFNFQGFSRIQAITLVSTAMQQVQNRAVETHACILGADYKLEALPG